MLVVEAEQMKKVGTVRVVVMMRRVAVGRTAEGIDQDSRDQVQAGVTQA